jgi:hypothetical protein
MKGVTNEEKAEFVACCFVLYWLCSRDGGGNTNVNTNVNTDTNNTDVNNTGSSNKRFTPTTAEKKPMRAGEETPYNLAAGKYETDENGHPTSSMSMSCPCSTPMRCFLIGQFAGHPVSA